MVEIMVSQFSKTHSMSLDGRLWETKVLKSFPHESFCFHLKPKVQPVSYVQNRTYQASKTDHIDSFLRFETEQTEKTKEKNEDNFFREK